MPRLPGPFPGEVVLGRATGDVGVENRPGGAVLLVGIVVLLLHHSAQTVEFGFGHLLHAPNNPDPWLEPELTRPEWNAGTNMRWALPCAGTAVRTRVDVPSDRDT